MYFLLQLVLKVHFLVRYKASTCGCVDDLAYKQAPLCSINQSAARQCVDEINSWFNPNKLCNCPGECTDTRYDVTITHLEWPTNRSVPRFIANVYNELSNTSELSFMLQVTDRYMNDKKSNTRHALNYLSSTFGSFTVYFRDLSEIVIEERPVYNFVTILSNFGGLLGLYLGISVLTVCELIDFLFDASEYLRLTGKRKQFQRHHELQQTFTVE